MREKWTQVLAVPGGLAVLIGGVDPLEGSILILIGTALLAGAALVARADRGVLAARGTHLALAAFGFAAVWILTIGGGVGGSAGRSMAWAALGLPLAAAWSLSFWGRGAPRWMNWLGLLGGGWYLALPMLVMTKSRTNPHILWSALAALAVFGVATVAGCVWRLRQPRPISENT